MKHMAFFAFLFVLLAAAPAGAAEFVVPRAMGPVIARNDLQVQYEYYVDKAGKVQTYIAVFDGKTTIRISPAAAEKIARETGAAMRNNEQGKMFVYDQGTCAYQVADGQRHLVIAPTNGTPITLTDADIDAFVRNCSDAESLAATWPQEALKLPGAQPAPAAGSSLRPGAAPAPAASVSAPAPEPVEEGVTKAWLEGFVPESVMKHVPEGVMSAGDRGRTFVRNLHGQDKMATVAAGALGLLCLILFLLGRRHKKNAYRVHEYAQEEMRELDRRRQEELAAASAQVNDMARQVQRLQRGNDEAVMKLKEEYAENSVIFADMVADLVRARDRGPESGVDLVAELAKKYGGAPGDALSAAREKSRTLAKGNRAATCSDANERYRKAACSFITDVFNMKTDQAAAMVNNGMGTQGLSLFNEASKTINAYGRALFQAEVTDEYIRSREDELKALQAVREGAAQ